MLPVQDFSKYCCLDFDNNKGCMLTASFQAQIIEIDFITTMSACQCAAAGYDWEFMQSLFYSSVKQSPVRLKKGSSATDPVHDTY